MYPDDVYRNELRAVIETLSAWAAKYPGDVETRASTGFWQLVARPKTKGACPLTLVLRSDQKFDMALAGETFEDRPVEDFALFEAVAAAVSEGRVEQTRSPLRPHGRAPRRGNAHPLPGWIRMVEPA